MSEKQDLIKRLLEMQTQFIAWEHDGGIDGAEYYNTDKIKAYRDEYAELSDKLINMAHADKGSLRE
ncbi:MAG TPA: hypothetical protein EYN73_05425 [Chromatiaceae bacterium]|jgi:hypothetical protein|nr:hypothetical protein [Chromatiaceae bacterium]HIA08500.1 hypothetical protein [Chromatiaceae bacterium]HIO55380.1 hypothetical protein [Chromatiales bacterium]